MEDNIPYIEDYDFNSKRLPRSKMGLYYDKLSFECIISEFGESERFEYILVNFLNTFGDSPDVRDFLRRNLGESRRLYRVRRDISHHYGTLVQPVKKTGQRKPLKTEMEEVFDGFYVECMETCIPRRKKYFYIYEKLVGIYGVFEGIHDFLEKNLNRMAKRIHDRVSRFESKFNLNEWNYFVTITYDSEEFPDEESFRLSLKSSLSHFHTRYGWKYMGAFERAPETKRLHFHAVMYIPDDAMRGKLYKQTGYSKKKKRMETITRNTLMRIDLKKDELRMIAELYK